MEYILNQEDYLQVLDIISPLIEWLKEKTVYIFATKNPSNIRRQLDSIIYAANRLEIEELIVLKNFFARQFGSSYIAKAENNSNNLVDYDLIDKLKNKIISESFLIMRLKQLCKKKKLILNSLVIVLLILLKL